MSNDSNRVEIRSSIDVENTILANTLAFIEDSINYSYRNVYILEDYIPRELANFIEELRALPIIEMRTTGEEEL